MLDRRKTNCNGMSVNRIRQLGPNLMPSGFNWFLYNFFSSVIVIASLGFTYFVQLMSKIIIGQQYSLVPYSILFLIACICVCSALRYAYLFFKRKTHFEWNYSIKTILMRRILCRSYSDFKKQDRAYYVSLYNNDITFLEKNLVIARVTIVSDIVMLVCAVAYSLAINYVMTLLILFAGLFSTLFIRWLSPYAGKYNKTYMDALENYNEGLDDAVRGYATIYHSNGAPAFLRSFIGRLRSAEKDHAQSSFAMELVSAFVEQVSFIVQGLLCVASMFLIVRGDMDAIYFPVFVSLMNMMISPFYSIMTSYCSMKSCKDIRQKLWNELETPMEEMRASFQEDTAGAVSKKESGIHVRSLSFSYGDKPIYKRLSLDVSPGEHILIQGKSGSGKSTLMRLLTREIVADEGEIQINGNPISEIPRNVLFGMISVISQQPMLFRATILDNITMFQEGAEIDKQRLDKSVEQAGLAEFIHSLSDGLNTMLMDSGENLSGGEKQRLQLARAVYHQSRVLLADEVTAGLDLEKAVEIEQLLHRLNQIVIAVSHRKDIHLEEYYDKTYLLEDNRLVPAQ